jgi:NO-binding membrane sensor protein with MHYT domain
MNNYKLLLIAIFFTNLFCTIAGGHGIAPLAFVEFATIQSMIYKDIEIFPLFSKWTIISVLASIGQVLIVIALFRKNKIITSNKPSKAGNLFLLAAICTMLFTSLEQVWFTLLTCLPFLILTIIHFRNSANKVS